MIGIIFTIVISFCLPISVVLGIQYRGSAIRVECVNPTRWRRVASNSSNHYFSGGVLTYETRDVFDSPYVDIVQLLIVS